MNTSTSPKVQYQYADGSANTIRRTGITYPDGRALTYQYNRADDKLSRISSIVDGALLNNLISYWKLDETSGTRNDSQGSNNLADNNTVTSGTGKINNAGLFTAANSEYLSIASNSSLVCSGVSFTFSAWVKLNSTTNYQAIISKFNGSTNLEYELAYRIDNGNKFRFMVANSNFSVYADIDASMSGASTGTWYYLVAWSIGYSDDQLASQQRHGGFGCLTRPRCRTAPLARSSQRWVDRFRWSAG